MCTKIQITQYAIVCVIVPLTYFALKKQEVVTTNRPVQPSVTGTKIKYTRDKLVLNQVIKTS